MNERQTSCPECNTGMQPIKIIDATERNFVSGEGGSRHVELEYAAPDAKASFFTRTIPALGTVKGLICPECGLIVLRGEPKSS